MICNAFQIPWFHAIPISLTSTETCTNVSAKDIWSSRFIWRREEDFCATLNLEKKNLSHPHQEVFVYVCVWDRERERKRERDRDREREREREWARERERKREMNKLLKRKKYWKVQYIHHLNVSNENDHCSYFYTFFLLFEIVFILGTSRKKRRDKNRETIGHEKAKAKRSVKLFFSSKVFF